MGVDNNIFTIYGILLLLGKRDSPKFEHRCKIEKENDIRVCTGSGRVYTLGIQDSPEIPCRIRENAQFLYPIRELTATREAGFAKI